MDAQNTFVLNFENVTPTWTHKYSFSPKEPDRRYTYCPTYHHSMTVVPVNVEAQKKQAEQGSKDAWKTTTGWVFPGKKTMIESNKHTQRPDVARAEDLQRVGTSYLKYFLVTSNARDIRASLFSAILTMFTFTNCRSIASRFNIPISYPRKISEFQGRISDV